MKEKNFLTLVKTTTLFKTIVVGVKMITIGERDGTLLRIQEHVGIYSQGAG